MIKRFVLLAQAHHGTAQALFTASTTPGNHPTPPLRRASGRCQQALAPQTCHHQESAGKQGKHTRPGFALGHPRLGKTSPPCGVTEALCTIEAATVFLGSFAGTVRTIGHHMPHPQVPFRSRARLIDIHKAWGRLAQYCKAPKLRWGSWRINLR